MVKETMIKLLKKTRFFQLNSDGSLGDGLRYTDIPAGTLVEMAKDPPGGKYKTGPGMYLVKTPTIIGDLFARVWASEVQ
jgi:hypothetical protein